MGSIADKLAYTRQAREEIRAAIVAKGVECPGTAPFCQFDEYITQISGSGGSTVIIPTTLVPYMDSNPKEGITITASSEYSGCPCNQAFLTSVNFYDGSTFWAANSMNNGEYLEVAFNEKVIITSFELTCYEGYTIDFSYYDGTTNTWISAGSFTIHTANIKNVFIFNASTVKASKFRLIFTGATSGGFSVGGVQLYGIKVSESTQPSNCLENVLSTVHIAMDNIKLLSKIALADNITSSLISIDCTINNIIRIDEYHVKIEGDFSAITSISIDTLAGFFYDNVILSSNILDTSVKVKSELEFSTSNEMICTLAGRPYYKTNDIFAIGGHQYRGGTLSSQFYDRANWSNPILISEAPAGCYYYCPGYSTTDYSTFTYDKDNKIYYVSFGGLAMSGDLDNTNGRGVNLDEVPEIISAVENGRDYVFAVLDYYYGYI